MDKYQPAAEPLVVVELGVNERIPVRNGTALLDAETIVVVHRALFWFQGG
jgi:hypothetical protein